MGLSSSFLLILSCSRLILHLCEKVFSLFYLITEENAAIPNDLVRNIFTCQNWGEGEEKALSASVIIKIIIFSPVIEELFNRCAVITILKTILKADNVVYMLISAVIFAMFHINSLKQSGFMPEISNLLIYFILGMGCAYVYLRTNNIVSAIVLHMFWNVSIVGGIISDIAHR